MGAGDAWLAAAHGLERWRVGTHPGPAARSVEPLVQGSAGMAMDDAAYLVRARELCTRYEIHLIADEIMTGFGRTGKMFACEVAGIVPDLMCLSKGITGGFLGMGATVCSDRVEAPFRSENRLPTFYQWHLYTGNALARAPAHASPQSLA